MLLRRRGALRFRGEPAVLACLGTWATSSKTLSLGLPVWIVVVLQFPDVCVCFRFPAVAVGAGELVVLDLGASALDFLRGLRAITEVQD